ncbi:hypothetical protein [Gemmata sp.]|uniref:hypothetical protein n=1 Tax=Gemmata sp. TaxID=1914242 RepID=UPI003F72050A
MHLMQSVFQPLLTIDRVEADDDEKRFVLKATGGGFLAKLLGLGTKATVTVNETGFRLQKTRFGSDEVVFIPRGQIATTVRVVARPVELLVFGLSMMGLAVVNLGASQVARGGGDTFGPMVAIFALLGVVLLVAYFLSKRRITLGVGATGGTVESLKLKADEDSLEEIRAGMKILEAFLTAPVSAPAAVAAPAAPSRSTAGWVPVADPAAPADAQPEAFVVTCASCGSQMNVPAAAAGKRVRCSSCRGVFVAERGA